MSDTRKVFDPFADPEESDAPIIRIRDREIRLFTDMVASKDKQLRELGKRCRDIADDDEADGDTLAEIVGELVEAASTNGEGVKDTLVEAWNNDEIGFKALTGLVHFVHDHLKADTDPEG